MFREGDDDGAYVYRKSDNKLLLSATLPSDSMYVIDTLNDSGSALFTQPAETAELWHRRLGHRNYRSLAHMHRLGLLQGCRLAPADFVQAGLTPGFFLRRCTGHHTHKRQ